MINTTKEQSIEIKHDGCVNISEQTIFLDTNNNVIGKSDRWRIGIEKNNNAKLIEILGESKANAIINEHWSN